MEKVGVLCVSVVASQVIASSSRAMAASSCSSPGKGRSSSPSRVEERAHGRRHPESHFPGSEPDQSSPTATF